MINLYNNKVVVSRLSPLYNLCIKRLTIEEFSKSGDKIVSYLYDKIDNNGDIEFSSGLLYLFSEINLEDVSKSSVRDVIRDNRSFDLSIDVRDLSDNYIKNILPGISLRDDQVLSIRKILYSKRGILQLSTGAGKTEIFSGFIKILLDKFSDEDLNILILEPSLYLVKSTISRLNKYGINAYKFNKSKLSESSDIEGICVTHPSALNKLLDEDPYVLSSIQVIISDEGHHLKANTWSKIINNSVSIEYSLAFSATVFDKSGYNINTLHNISYDESLVISATGKLLIDIPPIYYISKGILAHPKYYRISNPANEYIRIANNWSMINKYVIESAARTELVSLCSAFMSLNKFKVLILVNTKRHAFKILKVLSDSYKLSSVTRCSFGTGLFYKYDDTSKSEVAVDNKDEDTMKLFESGEVSILIGTSHLYEGVDIPNLDSVVLAGAGRGLRRFIQGIGRSLRITKTGNYAHIIDFTDSDNGVLSYHSSKRFGMFYRLVDDYLGDTYDNISFKEFKSIFMKNEINAFSNKNNKKDSGDNI